MRFSILKGAFFVPRRKGKKYEKKNECFTHATDGPNASSTGNSSNS